jgi:hypothetical protein
MAINTRIGEYKRYNAQPVLIAVEQWIRIIEARKAQHGRFYRAFYRPSMYDVCNELSIFDWWVNYISVNHLKQMRTFLKEAIKLGYTGYVCFKVGASGCANGMWAYKTPTVDGFSPREGAFLYRSFSPDYTYWEVHFDREYGDRADRLTKRVGKKFDDITTIKELEEALKEVA